MTADPRLLLEIHVAYLRLALREGGLPLDVPGGRAYSRDLRTLVDRGELAMLRVARGSGRPNVLHTTPRGIDRLAGILERYGEDFGPVSVLANVENVRSR